ncbi:putative ABC-2 type transporter [Helianthus annuus]|nr:putative ABC-2 type transporter [Helianthus annuus]KAJ0643371.1 putative ABC-2 type transporter [Helianthus annuus]KAJ0834001.1 putative ABC-2 type transporter [Helianthus annuus]
MDLDGNFLFQSYSFVDFFGQNMQENKALIAELGVPRPDSKDLFYPTQYSQPFLVQCIASLWKQRWSYWRNPAYTVVRFVFTTFIGVMFGTMFWDLGGKK